MPQQIPEEGKLFDTGTVLCVTVLSPREQGYCMTWINTTLCGLIRLLINASELDISTLFDTKFACLITIHLYLLDHLQSASIMHLSDIRIPR